MEINHNHTQVTDLITTVLETLFTLMSDLATARPSSRHLAVHASLPRLTRPIDPAQVLLFAVYLLVGSATSAADEARPSACPSSSHLSLPLPRRRPQQTTTSRPSRTRPRPCPPWDRALGCGERGRESESPPSRQHHTMTTGACPTGHDSCARRGGARRAGRRERRHAAERYAQGPARQEGGGEQSHPGVHQGEGEPALTFGETAFERRSGSPSVTHRMHSQFRGCHLQAGRG